MPKKIQHNYEALKTEFFTSEEDSIYKFYQKKFGKKMAGSVANRVKGWSKEKKEFVANGLKEAQLEAKEEIKKTVRPQIKELEEKLANILKLVDLKIKGLYDNAFELVYDKYGEVVYKTGPDGKYLLDNTGARIPLKKVSGNLSATELQRLYDMVKTELGEPSRIQNSRLSDMEGKELPPITGLTVEIVSNNINKSKKGLKNS